MFESRPDATDPAAAEWYGLAFLVVLGVFSVIAILLAISMWFAPLLFIAALLWILDRTGREPQEASRAPGYEGSE